MQIVTMMMLMGVVAEHPAMDPRGPCRVEHYGGRDGLLVRVEEHRRDARGRAVETVVRSGLRPADVLERTRRTFDRAGRLTTETNERWLSEQRRWEKEVVEHRWDAAGREIAEVRRARKGPAAILRHEYDARGRRSATIALADGRPLTRTDYRYDERGRLAEEVYGPAAGPPSWTIRYTHDSEGRLIAQTHPAVGTTTFERDAAGRVIEERTIAPDGRRVQDVRRRYDAEGREIERVVVAAVVGGEETRRMVFEYACPGPRSR